MKYSQNLTPVTLIDAAEYNYNDFDRQVHARDFCALSYRISSDAVIESYGENIFAGEGSVTFFPAEVGYHRRCTHDKMLVLHFDAVGYPHKNIESVYPKNESVLPLFESIIEIWSKKQHGYRYRAVSLLYELFYQLETEFGNFKQYPKLLEDAIQMISQHFFDPLLTVSEVSKVLGISEVYLRRLFADNIGKSPKQYITDLRIDKAKALFKQTNNSVEAVATLCGFSEPKNFAVAFKNKAGLTPSDYRKKYSSYI